MKNFNVSETWLKNTIAAEQDFDVSAGPADNRVLAALVQADVVNKHMIEQVKKRFEEVIAERDALLKEAIQIMDCSVRALPWLEKARAALGVE